MTLSNGEDGRLLAYCHGGHQFDELLPALVPYGLLDSDDDTDFASVDNSAVCRRDEAARIAQACYIHSLGNVDERIEVYRRSRGITITSPILRFSEQAPHRLVGRRPALLAPFVDVHGQLTAVHMTFMKHDGSGKADLPKEFQRECRGVVRGAAIRLMAHDPARALVLGEGIESTMAAAEIFGLPGWAAGSAGGLKTIELPPDVQQIVIAADHDESGCSQRNAIEATRRWEAEGRTVRIVMPKTLGDDFNDVLVKRRG
jgi:putative DNA primase/helicase